MFTEKQRDILISKKDQIMKSVKKFNKSNKKILKSGSKNPEKSSFSASKMKPEKDYEFVPSKDFSFQSEEVQTSKALLSITQKENCDLLVENTYNKISMNKDRMKQFINTYTVLKTMITAQ